MTQEPIVFVGPEGVESAGVAEVIRYSNANRIIRATMFVIAGLIGGTVCIIVPVVHLITTWGFPLVGILMAIRTMKQEVWLDQPAGLCPHCNQPIELPGGGLLDEEWQVCPQCKTKLQVRVTPVQSDEADRPTIEPT